MYVYICVCVRVHTRRYVCMCLVCFVFVTLPIDLRETERYFRITLILPIIFLFSYLTKMEDYLILGWVKYSLKKTEKKQQKILRKKKKVKTRGIFVIAQWTTEYLSFLTSWNFQMEGPVFRSKVLKKNFENRCYSLKHKYQQFMSVDSLNFRAEVCCRSRLPKEHWSAYKYPASGLMYLDSSWVYLPEQNISWARKIIQNQVLRFKGCWSLQTWSFQRVILNKHDF